MNGITREERIAGLKYDLARYQNLMSKNWDLAGDAVKLGYADLAERYFTEWGNYAHDAGLIKGQLIELGELDPANY